MRLENVTDRLASCALFAGADDASLTAVAEKISTRHFVKNQAIFIEGDDARSMFVVASGLVRISVTSMDGAKIVLSDVPPSGSFGELSLLDKGRRSASAHAASDTVALELQRDDFVEVLYKNVPVMESLLSSIGKLVRQLTEHTSDMVFLDVTGRVAKLLLQLKEEAGSDAGIDLRITQGDIAARVGSSRQRVNIALKELEKRGYIAASGKSLVIKNVEKLQRRAGF